MSISDKIRAHNGIINFLNNLPANVDIGSPKGKTHREQDEHINNILLKYGKENNLKLTKNNSKRYKGSFRPVIENSYDIQDNFKSFREWIIKNYSL